MPSSYLKVAAERSRSTSGKRQRGLNRGSRDLRTELRLDAATSLKPTAPVSVSPRSHLKGLTVSGGLAERAGGSEEEEEAAQSRPEPRRQHGTSNIHRSEEEAGGRLTALHLGGEAAPTAAP